MFLPILCTPLMLHSQSIDVENFGQGKPFTLSGSVSASGVYYNSNLNNARAPFTYFLQGGLNASIYGFSIPVSYSITNQGDNLGYKLPFDFNRISLHPKYKWITAHIGSIGMDFSPYTLSGHQFTGGGLELAPEESPFKLSLMSGRLLKAVEEDVNPNTIPSFKRMGYGIKAGFVEEKYSIGVIAFYAKDDINSIAFVPVEKEILPMENLVLAIEGTVKVTPSFSVMAEYASSALTKDLRADKVVSNKSGLAGMFFKSRLSTQYFGAYKAKLNYTVNKSAVGVGYERIDPGYETLGAYYFNNDLENITLDASSTFFKDKLNVMFNVGYQKDDIKNQSSSNTSRMIGFLNANFALSDRINISGSYSNFQTYTNTKPNQFDDINDSDLLDEELEALDYKQLSQSASMNFMWITKNDKNNRQTFTFNYALNDVANERGGRVGIGDASTFHNTNTGYGFNFPENDFDVNSSVNFTYNTIGSEDATTWGPTLGVGKRFFERALNTKVTASYNTSGNTHGKTNVLNLRGNASFIYKDNHNFTLNLIQLFRNSSNNGTGTGNGNLSEFTATLGYNYAFGIKKPHFNRGLGLRFTYRENVFKGLPNEITSQIKQITTTNVKNPIKDVRKELLFLWAVVNKAESRDKKQYEAAAINYLDTLYFYIDFLEQYDNLIVDAFNKLLHEARRADYDLEQEYNHLHAVINSAEKPNIEDIERLPVVEKKFTAHRLLLTEIQKLDVEKIEESKSDLKGFKKKYISKVYVMVKNKVSHKKIIDYLEVQMADVYHKLLNR